MQTSLIRHLMAGTASRGESNMAIKFDANERAIAQCIGDDCNIDMLEDAAGAKLAELESAAVASHGVNLDAIDDLNQTETVKRISDSLFAASFSASVRPSAKRNEF
jgi:hypothetical protein